MSSVAQIETLVNSGRYLEACKSAKEQLKTSNDLRLKQLYALALSKSGSPEAARDFLEPVYSSGERDPETAGILGGIYKELFRKTQTSSFATSSRDTYLANFQATSNYYTGINAAAMSSMLMQSSKGKEIARQVIAQLTGVAKSFWEVATLAEAYLLVKERQLALDSYTLARKMAGNDWGPIMSVYRQLWLLNHYVPVPQDLMSMFEPPRVAAFVGHMIDRPDRTTPRFPPSIEPAVATAIKQNIERLKLQVGYCALACGSDILFAEAMAEHGGAVNILLPFDVSDFVEQSVRFAGEHWVERFQSLARKFPVTYITNEQYGGNDGLFLLQGKVILGSAVLESRSFQSDPILLTVLSQADLAIKEGGTRSLINNWPFSRSHVNIGIESFGSRVVTPRTATPRIATERKESKGSISYPLQYLVRVDVAGLNSIEQEKLWTSVEGKEGLMHCTRHAVGANVFILSFEYETGAIEILKLLHRITTSKKIAISLNVGPVSLQQDHIAGVAVEELTAMATYAAPGKTIASHSFAALLALLPAEFHVEYSSSISLNNDEEQRVYYVSTPNP